MMGASLIPLAVVTAILVLFLCGAWPIGAFPTVVIVSALLALSVVLVHFLDQLEMRRPAHR